MPERILRDVTDSDRYNAVSVYARDTFMRLLNKADDYGCLVGDAKRLRVLLYPILVDEISEGDVSRWVDELEKADLIRKYEADGKRYLQILRWRQRLRSKKRKYPTPPWDLSQPQPPADSDQTTDSTQTGKSVASDAHVSDICQADDGHVLSETESEAHTETEPPKPPMGADDEARTHASRIISRLKRAHEIGPKDRAAVVNMIKIHGVAAVEGAMADANRSDVGRPVSYASEVLSRTAAAKSVSSVSKPKTLRRDE